MAKVGFIGLGNIGRGICNNLISGGNELTVYDINRAAMERFEGKATLAESLKDVCENSEYIFLSLPNTRIVEETAEVFLRSGVEGKTIIDTSTSYPVSTRNLYDKIKAAGGNLVDAPLMAGPAEAEAGTLEIVVGGDTEVVEGLQFLFDAYCSKVKHVGKIGNGHLAKLAVNYCGLTQALTLATVFPVMTEYGMESKELYEILNCEALVNWMFRFYGEKYVNRDYRLDFDMALGQKDLAYVKELFDYLKIPGFMLDGALELCQVALKDRKQGEVRDFSYACEVMYELLGDKTSGSKSAEDSQT